MTNHFIQRLIFKSTGKESEVFMRPAITPDVLPMTLVLPDNDYTRSTTTEPEVPEDKTAQSINKLETKPKQETTRKEKTADKTRSQPEVRPKEVVPVENKVKTRYTKNEGGKLKHKPIEEQKSEKTTKDTTKGRQSFRVKGESTEKVGFQLPHSEIGKKTSREKAGSDQKKRVDTEEPLRVIPREPEHVKMAPPETYRRRQPLMQEGKRLEREGDYVEPTVNINIERIEVRAIMPKELPVKKDRAPALALKDYLEHRKERTL